MAIQGRKPEVRTASPAPRAFSREFAATAGVVVPTLKVAPWLGRSARADTGRGDDLLILSREAQLVAG
jgi:hypothetical protein